MVGSNRNYYWGYTDSIAGEPYEYVKYGPLLYALPIKDIDENHVAEGQKYNYALGASLGKVKIIRKKMPERWTWKYEEAPVQLSVDAREFPWTPTDLAPYPNGRSQAVQPHVSPLCPTTARSFMSQCSRLLTEKYRHQSS